MPRYEPGRRLCLGKAALAPAAPHLVEHGRRQVYGHHAPARPHLCRRLQRHQPSAGAHIQHGLARAQAGQANEARRERRVVSGGGGALASGAPLKLLCHALRVVLRQWTGREPHGVCRLTPAEPAARVPTARVLRAPSDAE